MLPVQKLENVEKEIDLLHGNHLQHTSLDVFLHSIGMEEPSQIQMKLLICILKLHLML
jgi:hypothetical protein